MSNKAEIRDNLKRKGGNWLGMAREYMKWKVPRGDVLCWGCDEPVTVPFRLLEEIALESAVGVLYEYDINTLLQELKRVKIQSNSYAKRLVLEGHDDVRWEVTGEL